MRNSTLNPSPATKGCASAPLQGIAGLFAFQAGEIDKAEQLCRAGIAAAPSPSHPDTLFCWQGLVSCDAHHGLRDELREHVTAYATAAGNAADPFSGAMHYALAALFPSDEAIEYVATAKALRGRLDSGRRAASAARTEALVGLVLRDRPDVG